MGAANPSFGIKLMSMARQLPHFRSHVHRVKGCTKIMTDLHLEQRQRQQLPWGWDHGEELIPVILHQWAQSVSPP